MIIVAGGDSFIFGAELADQTRGNYSNSTIPALLAKSVDAEYTCVAMSGNANNAIVRQVMNYCEQSTQNDLFVFVMWTFVHRYEFRFNYQTGRKSGNWYSINLWDIVDDPADIKKEFANESKSTLDSHVTNKLILDNTGLTDFAKTFYKHVGNSEIYELYTSLREIVFLQNYLKLKKIPYMFTSADTGFNDTDLYDRHRKDVNVSSLYNQIEWDRWYNFPRASESWLTTAPRGFYQWAVENKYPVGVTHPLEQAHVDAANLMQEKFNELVKKSI